MEENTNIKLSDNLYIIGAIPNWIIRWGYVIIFIILILIVVLGFRLKFPVVIQGNLYVDQETHIFITMPVSKREYIQTGQSVSISFDDYPYLEYGIMKGYIGDVSVIYSEQDVCTFPVVLRSESWNYAKCPVFEGMGGTIEVIIKNDPVIYRLFRLKY